MKLEPPLVQCAELRTEMVIDNENSYCSIEFVRDQPGDRGGISPLGCEGTAHTVASAGVAKCRLHEDAVKVVVFQRQ